MIDGQAKAYPLRQVKKAGVIEDQLEGKKLRLSFEKVTDSLFVVDERGNNIEQMTVYWFVWKAIWPKTERF